MPRGRSSPSPSVRPDRGLFPDVAAIHGHQGVSLRNRPSVAPAPASGVSLGCSAAAQVPPANALEPAHGRSLVHMALSPPGRSAAPTCREDRV
ncbi:hypothetical protein NDU88_004528 [Pleurodeles waltl]|uniref:Uncharacterized protein n=1 Tax=Pleurodeles waltl TaxID=8319 RepID=A0AAV7NPK8_PLEWA|nr:hypothetical protein NDU88_004528 [Pleurodeles waltl]